MLKISFVIIYRVCHFVKNNLCISKGNFGNPLFEVIFMKLAKQISLFLTGGSGYVLLELCWRGWSHGSMFLAGGVCFLLLGTLDKVKPRLPLPFRALAGAGIITMVELLAGLIFNRDYRVWDYRSLPLNFGGQICLRFCLLWIPISLAAMVLYRYLDRSFPKTRPAGHRQADA